MTSAIDASMRKLKFPPRFVPYLEKHRIYELFYDLGECLAMYQPEDHIMFLKNIVAQNIKARDNPKVILITPPYIDKICLAKMISTELQIKKLSRHIVCKDLPQFVTDPENLAVRTFEAILKPDVMQHGWIFVDFPETKEEAKALIKHRILPTHTILLIPSDAKNSNEDLWFDFSQFWSSQEIEEAMRDYERNLHHLKEIYQSSLKEVVIGKKNMEEISTACCRIIRKVPNREPSIIFRLVLIGARGSQRRTLAKMLHRRFNMVQVDMEEIMNRARVMDNELGDEIRDLDKRGVRIFGRIVVKLLQERLLQDDCLNRGYVLINFPRDENDFTLLDLLDTPPNRVIFLDITTKDCKNRITDRRINMYTGKIYSAYDTKDDLVLNKQLLTHPEDTECKVDFDHENCQEYISNMKLYCMTQCAIINATDSLPSLYENVESVLMSSSPAGPPRNFRPSHPTLKQTPSFFDFTDMKTRGNTLRFDNPPETTNELMDRYEHLMDLNFPSRYSRPMSTFVGYIERESNLRKSEESESKQNVQEMDQEPESETNFDELDNIVERFRQLRGF